MNIIINVVAVLFVYLRQKILFQHKYLVNATKFSNHLENIYKIFIILTVA